ncbi:MAG TPA: hypothetical protein VKU01_11935 [Bryobacteraceae bacterium]|nr:hypothetical protein [Bryobacteraceae bacterium]
MKLSVATVVTLTAALPLDGVLFGQSDAINPIKTSVCDLVREPARFSGKIVQVRAAITSSWLLTQPGCVALLPIAIPDHPNFRSHMDGYEYAEIRDQSDVNHPKQLTWHRFPVLRPVTLLEDANYSQFRNAIDSYFIELENDTSPCQRPWRCPKFDVTATFTGRFDYERPILKAIRRAVEPRQIWTSSVGFRAGSLHDLFVDWQILLQSVSDVDSQSIARSVYDKQK